MNNLIKEISEKHHDFIAANDYAPSHLYLGEIAYRAFIVTMMKSAPANDVYDKPYMGMKVNRVINDPTHINLC